MESVDVCGWAENKAMVDCQLRILSELKTFDENVVPVTAMKSVPGEIYPKHFSKHHLKNNMVCLGTTQKINQLSIKPENQQGPFDYV